MNIHKPEGYARGPNNLLEAQHMNCLASAKASACDGNAAAVTEIHPKVGNRFMRVFRKGSTEKSHLTLFGII